MQKDQLVALVTSSFPTNPLPQAFFWSKTLDDLTGDIPLSLSNGIKNRPWDQVTLLDWAMIGTPPVTVRDYFDPAAFLYYLPSLFLGVLQDPRYMDFALDCMVPFNQKRVRRGEWWEIFEASITDAQRKAGFAFLQYVLDNYDLGDADAATHAVACVIWGNDQTDRH